MLLSRGISSGRAVMVQRWRPCGCSSGAGRSGAAAAAAGAGAARGTSAAAQRRGPQLRRRRASDLAPRAALRDETPEQARERRLRESARVEERVTDIYTMAEFKAALEAAGSKLVVLEAQSERVCMTGLDEEPELHWKADQEAALMPCVQVKHTFQRTARECPDVVFLSLQVDTDEAQDLCDELGIDVIPSLQFWRNGVKLWEVKGVEGMGQDLGEGVLFFNGSAANGVQASDHVTELSGDSQLRAFVAGQSGSVLTVVDVSLSSAAPCIHVYPAVLALARSFKGFAAFGRVLADSSPAAQEILKKYNVVEVPTFLFFKEGREVDRHVGSSRGDLIGKILEVQSRFGVKPPPPPGGAAAPKRVIQRRVTRRARP